MQPRSTIFGLLFSIVTWSLSLTCAFWDFAERFLRG